ncbi:MAG: divalent-cation tolerance protein CutA [Coleofasciculaceae cyanobacterium]
MENNPAATEYCVVLVTASSQEEGKAIAKALVEAKLAACVTLIPAHSIYAWQSQVMDEQQWQMVIKTKFSQFSLLENKIRELHSDEVPEIFSLPIVAGFAPYLQWISDSVKTP